MKQLFENKINKLRIMNFLYLLPVIFAFITYLINFWQVNKGINMADEGYILFLLKDIPNGQVTSFFKLFQNIFHGNINSIRLTLIIMNFLGTFIYSIGVSSFFKQKIKLNNYKQLCIWGLTSMSFSVTLSSITYMSFNGFLQLTAVGLILLALVKQTNTIARTLYLLSGFLLGFHIFVMITNILIIPLTIIFVYYLSNKGLKNRNCLYVIFGIIISIVTYFMFFDSFNSFWNTFIDAFNKTTSNNLDSSHGLHAMIIWIRKTILYYTIEILLGVVFLYGIERINKFIKPNFVKYLLIFWILIFFLVFFRNILDSTVTTVFLVIYLFYLLQLSQEEVQLFNRKDYAIFLYVLTIPFFLSLGTDVPFSNRASAYFNFLFPLIFVLSLVLTNSRFYYIILATLVSFFFINKLTCYTHSTWSDIIYTEQNINVQKIGIKQNLQLDNEKILNLIDLKTIINDSDKVVVVDPHLWGYAYLLNTRPVSYSFWYDSNEILSKIRNNPSLYRNIKFMIRDDTKIWWGSTFNPKYLESVKNSLRAKKIIIHTFSIGKVYCFE